MKTTKTVNSNAFFNSVKKNTLLTREGEVFLGKIIQKGEDYISPQGHSAKWAKEQLVLANLRFVIKTASKYIHYYNWDDYLEIIQEGCMGLMSAADKFNPELGNKFLSYATSWVTLAIRRYLTNIPKTIRVPVGTLERHRHLHKAKKLLDRSLTTDCDSKFLSGFLELSPSKTKYIFNAVSHTSSMELSIGSTTEGRGMFIKDLIGDQKPLPDQVFVEQAVEKATRKLLRSLTSVEEHVLRSRFGIFNK